MRHARRRPRTRALAAPAVAALAAVLAAALPACGGGGDAPSATPEAEASFAVLQARVLTSQCVSCHSSAAPQGGLALDGASAHAQLVDAQPTHPTARADGLRRVVPGDTARSLLWHKLVWAPGHHARDYGLPMPLGTPAGLTQGELAFVRRWIEAGAPRDGRVADVALLDDRRPQRIPTFEPLPRPAQGIQLRVDSFGVRPNFERELFVLRPLNNASDVFVNRFEFRMRPGSHHLLLYDFDNARSQLCTPSIRALAGVLPGQVRDIRNPDGSMNMLAMAPMACHVFVAGSMTQTYDWRFPEGVALRLPANTALDFNLHYVNKTGAELPGEAYANLHTVDRSQVRFVARPLNLGNEDLVLPPRRRTTVTKEFPVRDSAMTIVALTSHMHALGERFVIRIKGGPRDGQVVYENTDWEHPAMTTFTPALVLRRGEALVSTVTFNNTRDRTVRFGLTSDDEMAIIFGYWY